MEINGRIWGSLPLAVKSGMDFPARLADLYLGGGMATNGRPATDYRVGVRSRNLELEVVWIGSTLRGNRRYPFLPAPRRREAVTAAARLVLPGDGFDILSLDDPRPGLVELASDRVEGQAKNLPHVLTNRWYGEKKSIPRSTRHGNG